MRIGVDLDDTICRTTEIVHDRIERYSETIHMNPLDIMNDELLKEGFFKIYLEDIYTNVEIKRNVQKVLKRLRNKGNEIYLITARSNSTVSTVKNMFQIIDNWLKNNEIEVDAIILSAYGESPGMWLSLVPMYFAASFSQNVKRGLEFFARLLYNYKKITSEGIKCLLFDDRERYDLKEDYFTNWLDIEKYIERNR